MYNTTLQTGTLLQDGKYRIEKVLGRNIFLIVYLAYRVSDNKKLVIKEYFFKDYCDRNHNQVIVSNSNSFSKYKHVFEIEGQILSKLDHKFIVKYVDSFEENNTAYIVTEFASGVELSNYLEASTRFECLTRISEKRSEDIIVLIAEALHYLHKNGICHLAVKPSNIMFDHHHYDGYSMVEPDTITLLDFSCARPHLDNRLVDHWFETSTTDNGLPYTEGYSPLELSTSNPKIEPTMDIYALGATWFRLLTGDTPPGAVEILENGFVPIEGVSAKVNNAIKQAMSPLKKNRPQNIPDFLALLGKKLPENVNDDETISNVEIDEDLSSGQENQALPVGTELQGKHYKYIIKKVLGSGSFGITYLASVKLQGALGMLNGEINVCVKEFFMKGFSERSSLGSVISAQNVEDSIIKKYSNKFLKESVNLSHLKNDNIIKVMESFEMNGTAYYVMEYIDGGSLDDYIISKNGIYEAEAIKLIKQIGTALSYMHTEKILHLDLKPKNIMLKSDGTCVLIDFGLSKQYNNQGAPESSTGLGAGTAGYAPLEQITYNSEKDFAPTLDVYALGATLYKMLTSMAPPPASEILNEGFPRQSLEDRNISIQTIDAIEKAMMPMKKMRPQSVSEFVRMLRIPESNETGESIILMCPRCLSRLRVKNQSGVRDKIIKCPVCENSASVREFESTYLSHTFRRTEHTWRKGPEDT